MNSKFVLTISLAMLWLSCAEKVECPPALNELDIEGDAYLIGEDGGLYEQKAELCVLVEQYFEPDFFEQNYEVIDERVFIRVSDEQSVPTRRDHFDDFESYQSVHDIFPRDIDEIEERYFTAFTMQSPEAKDAEDYNALRACILEESCDFIDNRLEVASDPEEVANTVMRFRAVAPSFGMVTSKASMSSDLPYFVKGDTLVFSARFRFVEGTPYSLVDFENRLFLQSPGPRVVVEEGALAFENKFGEKIIVRQDSPRPIPRDVWFRLRVEIVLDDIEGEVRMFQDDALILEANIPTLPLANSIQNSVEVGITATDENAVLLVDDFAIGNE